MEGVIVHSTRSLIVLLFLFKPEYRFQAGECGAARSALWVGDFIGFRF